MQKSEEIPSPLHLSVAAYILINACQKMVNQTIEKGTALDLVQLQKHLVMASQLLSPISNEAEIAQKKLEYEKPEIKDIFDFKN